jgi:hypothetical protein
MNLQQIIFLTRTKLNDHIGRDTQKLWSDAELTGYATDAEREISRELFCLHDSDTIGYLTLSGKTGQIDSVVVSGVTVTSATVVFSQSLDYTAALLAANINALTALPANPQYRAFSRGPLVFIKAVPNTGFPAAGYVITANASAGITAAVTELPGLCRYVIQVGQRYLTMSDKVSEITRFKIGDQFTPLKTYSKETMDQREANWETRSPGDTEGVVVDYDRGEIIVVPPAGHVIVAEVDCYRLPLVDFDSANMLQLPEIAEKYHIAMPDWMCRQAYRKNDVETMDLTRADMSEKEFRRRVEKWRQERNRRIAETEVTTNRPPLGLM